MSLGVWWRTNGSDDGSLPARVYGKVIERAGPTAVRHETTVALTLDLRAASSGPGGRSRAERGRCCAEQGDPGDGTALHAADLTPSTPLDPRGLAVRLRSAYAPTAPLLERNPGNGRDPATSRPMAVTESWGSMRCDATRHTVL